MGSKGIVLSLLFFTAAGIAIYWILVFSGVFEIADIVPGYKDWFMSFPLADGWIAACALLSAVYFLKGNPAARVFGISTGSGLIFLGLYALLYGFNTRLLFNVTAEELIEIAIKLYCLSVGSYLIMYFGKTWNCA
ncbi:hypothetical protein HZA56_21840 [Candidatus Poribacteria bacterium]|nr:hypothetical protein [Candidatus Poribacteria bacterium]